MAVSERQCDRVSCDRAIGAIKSPVCGYNSVLIMNMTRVHFVTSGSSRGALAALLMLCAVFAFLTGCRDLVDGDKSNQLGGGDAGVCDKDRDALAQLLAQPQACATSESCPTGSHCSETGSCDWQCIADTDCGSGFTCSCDGQCTSGGETGADAGVTVDPLCPRDRNLLQTNTLTRACNLDEDCPFGSHCDGGTGRCSYQCLATNDPDEDFDCEGATVCDCLGRCVPPEGAPVEVTANLIQISLNTDLIEVPGPNFGNSPTTDPPRTFQITLRSDHNPMVSPAILLRAPSGLLLLADSATWTADPLYSTWNFLPEGNSYVARKTISVRSGVAPEVVPDAAGAPWAIQITGDGVTGVPESVLVNIASAGATPGAGIYEGYVTARIGIAEGVARIPVTAWATPQFILFFDPYRALSPDGVFGISRAGFPSYTTASWLAPSSGASGAINVALVTSINPLPLSNGDLKGGQLSAYFLVGHNTSKLDFDFELRRRGQISAPACTMDAACGNGHCEEELGYCAPGADWRASDWGTPLVSELASQWITASKWFLDGSTPGLFGIPVIPGSDGMGRILQCLPPKSALVTATSGDNVNVGFVHFQPFLTTKPPSQEVSGELLSTKSNGSAFCMQPVPLGLNRDHSNISNAFTEYPFLLESDDLLSACLDEGSATPPNVTGSQQINAAAWFGKPAYCLSPSRLFPILEWWLDRGWERKTLAGVEARSMHAVVSRWLAALSFIGSQATDQLAHNRTALIESSSSATSKVERALAMYESALAFLLNDRVVETLGSLPRDVIRNPDYRLPRPVAYYTFDVEDMNKVSVLDVTGGKNASLANASYSRPTTECQQGWRQCSDGIIANQTMTIPRGPAELYGDVQIAFSFQVPTIPVNTERALFEYGDANDLLYQIVAFNSSSGTRLAVRHGPRTSPFIPMTGVLTSGATQHVIVSRRARYTFVNGAPQWASEYRLYLNGGSSPSVTTSSQPLVTAFTLPNTARGTLNITGYINDLAIWDEAFDPNIDNTSRAIRSRDNYHLDIFPGAMSSPDHEQPVGLPAIVLETMASYLSTMAATTRNAAPEVYAVCLSGSSGANSREQLISRAGQGLRYSWAAETLADRLYAAGSMRTCTQDSDCHTDETCGESLVGPAVCVKAGAPVTDLVPWGERYKRALGELDAARTALIRELEPIVRCADPFGVSPAAVPLYFGDPLGTSARFFASSDYLLTTWANPAVARAQASLDQARDAWLAKRNSEIQQLQTEQQRAARLEEIEMRYAQPIIELCGLTGVEPLQVLDMAIDPDRCFKVDSAFCQTQQGKASAHCFRGEMGKAALAVISASRGVEVARKSAWAQETRCELQDYFCSDMQSNHGSDLQAHEKHIRRMKGLRLKRATASNVGSLLKSMVSALGSFNPGSILDILDIGAHAITTDYDEAMTQAEEDYQLARHWQSNRDEERRCWHEAQQMKYGIDVEYAVISQRLVDVELAILQLQNYKSQIRQIQEEARAALAREEARTLPSVAHHYWLDPKIDRFRRDFEWARRLTFLAARAVEFEFQQSLAVTADVLRAGSPDDLQNVLLELQQEQASRTINGRRPQQTSIVVSLRDEILQMSGRDNLSTSVLAPGERSWSAKTRFGKRLEAKFFSVYDDEGNYLGQGIPFTLRETGALKYRCAERLWRVNATIQGDIPNFSEPTIPVMLLKRNTFSSQWCEGKGGGSSHQMGTVFPSANLFKLQAGTTNDEADAYTAALLMPWFNVIRSEFYKEQYVDGSSEEFAGRGLYGDYVLLFPESGLLEWTDGDPSNDFPLGRAEDVLIRFDLISVDNLNL